jgi:hypothetical protein
MAHTPIQVLECTSAEDLLNRLAPRNNLWRPHPSPWIFRGQDGDWPLLPKAYRKGGQAYRDLGFDCDLSALEPPAEVFAKTQQDFLREFRDILDRTGLPIPSRPADLYHTSSRGEFGGEPAYAAYPQLALAQHLGLPTPLLDWSYRGAIAAYFAVPKDPPKTDEMVVWGLRTDFIMADSRFLPNEKEVAGAVMSLETAPRSGNANLHAQAGVFTLMRGDAAYDMTVDAFVELLCREDPKLFVSGSPPIMRKLTLKMTHASELLRLLAIEGIDAASAFPGYDGVARSMKERTLWKKPTRKRKRKV